MLFRKKSKPTAPDNQPVLIWSKQFSQPGTFKGYRRIKLSTYNDDQVASALKHFAKTAYSFKGCTIRLDNYGLPGVFADHDSHVINVYVDDKKIGYIYDSTSWYEMLTGYEYDKVYIKVEKPDVYLFVHYPGASPIKVSYSTK